MNQALIEARELTTAFEGTLIHDRISCTVYQNDIYAIIGGSGSGKTTLLREFILLQHPQSGSIRLLDYDLATITPAQEETLRRQWGVLFQSGALYTSLSVGENIAIVYREHTDLSAELIDELVDLKIKMVGLPPHARHLTPSELSGGMVKRAALARALALDPKLLFLDEPTSGLDPLSSRQFDTLIQNLRDLLGLTIVIITHDQASILSIANRLLVLGNTKVIAEGSLQEVARIDHPDINHFFPKDLYGIAH